MRLLLKAASVLMILLLLALAFWLLFQTDNPIPAVALLISVLSLTTSLVTINQVLDQKLPDLVVEVTDNRRYQLLTLVIRNVGKMTAYNIRIQFPDQPLIEYLHDQDNKEIRELNYSALAPGNELVYLLGASMYFRNLKDEQLVHAVKTTFNTSRKDQFLNRYSSDFTIDVAAFRETLNSPNEHIAAMATIPDHLKTIAKGVTVLTKQKSGSNKEERGSK